MIEAFVLNKFSVLWHWSARLRNYLLRNYIAKWKLWSLVVVFLGLVLVGLSVFAPGFERNLDPSKIVLVSETNQPLYAYPVEERVGFPWEISFDNPDRRTTSSIELKENDIPLKHNLFYYYTLDKIEAGYFAHSKYKSIQKINGWNTNSGIILFTTDDKSDPQISGKSYQYSLKSFVNSNFRHFLLIVIIVFSIPLLTYVYYSSQKLLNKPLFIKLIYFAIITIFIIGLTYIVIISLYLRPSKDDIAIANYYALYGFWGAQKFYWLNWAGQLFTNFYNLFAVGLPVSVLNWNLSSAVTLFVTLCLISLTVVLFYRLVFKIKPIDYLFGIASIIICWWIFQWTQDYIDFPKNINGIIAYGIVNWQNLNAAYIIPSILLLIILFHILYQNYSKFYVPALLALFAGFISGSNTFPINAAILFSLSIFLTSDYFLKFNLSSYLRRLLYIVFASTIVSTIVTVTAPGNFARMSDPQQFSKSLYQNSPAIIDYVSFMVSFIPQYYLSTIFSLSTLLTVIFTASLSYLIADKYKLTFTHNLLNLFLGILGFNLIHLIFIRMSEAFTYVAFWHYTGFLFVHFITMVVFGTWLGVVLARVKLRYRLESIAMINILLLAIFSLYLTNLVDINNRRNYLNWVAGYTNQIENTMQNLPLQSMLDDPIWLKFVKLHPHKSDRY